MSFTIIVVDERTTPFTSEFTPQAGNIPNPITVYNTTDGSSNLKTCSANYYRPASSSLLTVSQLAAGDAHHCSDVLQILSIYLNRLINAVHRYSCLVSLSNFPKICSAFPNPISSLHTAFLFYPLSV